MKSILAIIFIFFVLMIHSQTNSELNVKNDYGYYVAQGRAIIETDSFYIAAGRSKPTINEKSLGLHFSKHVKKSLEVKSSTIYYTDSIFFSLQEINELYKKNDSIVYAIDKGEGKPRTLKLLKYNINSGKIELELSIKWHEKLEFNFLSTVLENKNNRKIYCLSNSFSGKNDNLIIFTVIDSRNNYKNYVFGDTLLNNKIGYSFTFLNDSTIGMVSRNWSTDYKVYNHSVNLIDVNKMQIIKEVKINPTFNLVYVSDCIVYNKDTIFICGLNGKFIPGENTTNYQPCVFSYSISKQKTLKMQNFGETKFINIDGAYKAILKAKDGSIVYGGTSYLAHENMYGGVVRGVVGKLDGDNNTIWRRYYTKLLPAKDSFTTYNEIYDVEETSDGNFIAYGEVWGYTEEDKRVINEAWLFKIDQDGHLLKADTITNILPDIEDKIKVKVYPNPTQNAIYIEQDHTTDVDIYFINTSGQVVHKVEKIPSNTSIDYDVSTYPSGTYVVQIYSEGKKIGEGKFVKI